MEYVYHSIMWTFWRALGLFLELGLILMYVGYILGLVSLILADIWILNYFI